MDSLFDFPKPKIDKKIRLIELFAGVGAQAMAMRNIGADFERWRAVEFDKFAMASYNKIHGTDFPVSDIRNVKGSDLGISERDKYCYLMFYSFPCTDLSCAGLQRGMDEGSGTSSSLLWEVKRLIEELGDDLPQVLVMENVPQVHGEKNLENFEIWLSFLRGKGYVNFYKDLNAKDYGVPQNRERTFCVSLLESEFGKFCEYEFPNPIPLEKAMKDCLEDKVDEKWYLSGAKADSLLRQLDKIAGGGGRQLTCALKSREQFKSQTASRQGATAESQTCSRTTTVLLSGQARRLEKVSDVAVCLMSRDYKGFGNQASNGVIENVMV